MMRCVELFAGAGGAALGLEAAGIEHLALVEKDEDACKTLRAAGLGPVIEGDVRDLDPIAALGEGCDLLWSSFPCQCWSQAGSRLGARDSRNGWPWTVAAIDRLKPRWVLCENVRGLLSHIGGCRRESVEDCPRCYLDGVIIPQLEERFAHAGWFLLDAADLGVPQHRRRIIIWAGPKRLQAPASTHGPPGQGDLFRRLEPWVSMGEALGLGSQRVIGGGRNPQSSELKKTRNYRDLTDEPSTTVTAVQVHNAGPFVLHGGRNNERNPKQERPTPSTEPAPTIGGKGNQFMERPAPTVTAQEVKGTRASEGSGYRFKGGPDRASDALALMTGYAVPGEPAPAICGAESQGVGGSKARGELQKRLGRRRLTVQECATLQAFPPDHPWRGTNRSKYAQVGNAVPPPMAQAVAEMLLIADASLR
jgi:DNA (cytosine-5)-methyltransferase 1